MPNPNVEPVVLDHYSEDELCVTGGLVRPLGCGFLIQAGTGEDVTFLVADNLTDAVRGLKSILADKS